MSDILSTVLAAIRAHGVRYIRSNWSDNAGLIRANAVHATFLDEYLAGAMVGIPPASQALPVMHDAVAAGSGLTAAGEVFLRADWATFTPLPYAPGHARVLADVYDGDRPWAHDPRCFLRQMVGRAAEQGLRIVAAFQNEFYLLRTESGGLAPVDATVFCHQLWIFPRLAPRVHPIYERSRNGRLGPPSLPQIGTVVSLRGTPRARSEKRNRET